MKRQEFIDWAMSLGYKDFSHSLSKKLVLKKSKDDTSRYTVSDRNVRREKQIVMSDGRKEWVRIRRGYLKNLSINEEGKLAGMTR